MSLRPDHATMIAALGRAIELVNSGGAGVVALVELVSSTQAALGAGGILYVESGQTGGRVIAAAGAVRWALGLPVDAEDPLVTALTRGGPEHDVRLDAIGGDLARQLYGRGLRRVLSARAEVSGQVIGGAHALYTDADTAPPDGHMALVRLLASCAAHLYGRPRALPSHGDGRTAGALTHGLAVIGGDDVVRLWNRAAEQITDRPANQAVGRELPFPAPAPGESTEHRLGNGRWLEVSAGELPGVGHSRVVGFRDITDQHWREHDRDLFVAVTSHELRTPVTVIKGYADTLTQHWDSLGEPQRRDAVRVIGQRAGDLARLVDRLLVSATDAGRIGSGAPAPFDLVDELRAAVAELPAQLHDRIRTDLPTELPKALGDRTSVITVLTELVTNADRYAGQELVEITAGADEKTVYFRVSDHGVGVSPEHVERAFDRFWQGESGDRRRYPGAGLGLYLVRRIVERQNGWVSLQPREAGGTVAEVRLPRGDLSLWEA